MLSDDSPLQLVERPSGGGLLNRLVIDLVLVEPVQVERARPRLITVGYLLVGELVLVDLNRRDGREFIDNLRT